MSTSRYLDAPPGEGLERSIALGAVRKPEFDVDKRLPTPPQETPALVTPVLRPINPVYHSGLRSITPTEVPNRLGKVAI